MIAVWWEQSTRSETDLVALSGELRNDSGVVECPLCQTLC